MQHGLKRQKVCAAVFSLLLSSVTQAAWEEKYYNPKPLQDDVLLPMPCGGQMAFRKVSIPLAKPLDDYPLTLGQDGDSWGYLEQARAEHIAGSFTTDKPKPSRYYLLAKYELTELQYQSLISSECPKPANKLRLPQTGLSWFEAMAFSDRYNLWLRKNAKNKLPVEDGALGFVRLPTEAEWEFAARGGLAVSEAEFRDLLFPMPEGLNAYAWFAGAQSANGKLQLSGLLKANPLGLHDMLGNVDEMLFEPFRLIKPGRQHGQAGGYILRGGNYLTPQSGLRSALRQEQPYYMDDAEQRIKTSGVRLALVSPVLTSRERIKQVEQDWQALGTDKVAAYDPLKDISRIADKVEDKALKLQLETLRRDLRASAQARDEQRDQAIRSQLQLGAFLCTKLKDDGLFLDTLQSNYQRSCEGQGADETRCAARKKQLDGHAEVLEFVLNYYADSLVGSALNYPKEQMAAQLSVTEQQMQGRSKNNLQKYLQVHWKNLKSYLENGRVARSGWLNSCKSI
ncbi:formylglycine-generating enzyme family protein [Ventosimonas gracilis]|uniref:formylglycine-generating enzyme family protein n=1 Tax=Ventosimonas gracilis TaxID=1680762 RepID=UPI002699E34A